VQSQEIATLPSLKIKTEQQRAGSPRTSLSASRKAFPPSVHTQLREAVSQHGAMEEAIRNRGRVSTLAHWELPRYRSADTVLILL